MEKHWLKSYPPGVRPEINVNEYPSVKELIERGRHYFSHNTVVTNGTIPLPDWPDVNWYISIDGDEAMHEHIRNKKGIYKRAIRNVREHPSLSVTIADA